MRCGGTSSTTPSRRSEDSPKTPADSLRLADKRGEPLVVVLGHPMYYPRFGFRPAASLGIEPPDPWMPAEAFMVVPLGAYEPTLRGRVTFPPTFG